MAYSITTRDGITIRGIPDDMPADSPELRARVAKVREQQAMPQSFLGGVAESITGEARGTEASRALPEMFGMPEMNQLSWASARAGLGSLLAGRDEIVKIMQANFPNMPVRYDEKGNPIFTSQTDGKDYVLPPGLSLGDLPRIIAGAAAFTPAGRATTLGGAALAAGGTQAAIEGTQAASGGEFNSADVLIAGAAGAAVPAAARALRAGGQALRGVAADARPQPAAAAPGAPVVETLAQAEARAKQQAFRAAGSTPVEPVPTTQAVPANSAAAAIPVERVQQAGRTAAMGGFGSRKATADLAVAAAPDAETVAAAERLGILDHLQPDHYSANVAYRQLAQLVKSQTGSPAHAAEGQGLLQVAAKADEVLNSIGGSSDLSTLDVTVRKTMTDAVARLESEADTLYAKVRAGIDPRTQVSPEFVLSFVQRRADELGGASNLSAIEKKILQKLSPRPIINDRVPGIVVEEGTRNPTYALLDDVRRDVGNVLKGAGPFKDADIGLAKRLYALISQDQEAIVARTGLAQTYAQATQAVKFRKAIEDDLSALFGKALDGSFVSGLRGAIRALPDGDASKLLALISRTPPDLRERVVASGLSAFFNRTARGGAMDFAGYARWFEGLERNKQAMAAVMANLPKHSVQQLRDLARVARGVAMSKGEFIPTGKAINPRALEIADSLMGRVFDEVKRRGATGAVAEVIGTATFAPGFASALQSSLNQGRPTITQAADKLITSPTFVALVKAQASPSASAGQKQAAARQFAYSREFTRFARALGNPREMSNRERWVLQAMQARNQQSEK